MCVPDLPSCLIGLQSNNWEGKKDGKSTENPQALQACVCYIAHTWVITNCIKHIKDTNNIIGFRSIKLHPTSQPYLMLRT